MIYARITILFAFLFCRCFGFSQVDSGYVEAYKCKLFYRIYGKDQGIPLVFLNGGPGISSLGYERYAKALSAHCQVILFDQRGTGKSVVSREDQPTIHMDYMVHDLEMLRYHLEIKSWDVMGHSFGGLYAMHYAHKYPDPIHKLVISGSPALNPTEKYWFYKDAYLTMDAMDTAYLKQITEIKANLEQEKEKEPRDLNLIRKLYKSLNAWHNVYKPENRLTALNWFYKEAESNPETAILLMDYEIDFKSFDFSGFSKPVLILHGQYDFISLNHPKSNQALFSNVTLKVIPNAGHMILIDQPNDYIGSIQSFLNKNFTTK